MKKNLLFFFCVLAFQMAKAQVPNYIPADSLKDWWPFYGNANDNRTNATNGTLNGNALANDRFNSPNKNLGIQCSFQYYSNKLAWNSWKQCQNYTFLV